MRTDPTREGEFKQDEQWGTNAFEIMLFDQADEKEEGEDGPAFRSTPFSGNERNRLFMRDGDNYDDMTLVSGADFREDGRGFVLFDYDDDGWIDLGIISPNYPRLRIVKNKIGERRSNNGFVRIQLIGGQTSTEPSTQWSSRDAYGATVLVTTGDTKRIFQLSCGEGLSSQNAKRIHVGMGEAEKIDSLEVIWPSGKKTIQTDILSGSKITIFENPNANN